MTTPLDRRRLRDGELAAQTDTNYQAMSVGQLILALAQLHDGIAALQSTDDLGSPEANDAAWQNCLELQRRHKLVKEEMTRRSLL